MSENDAAHMQSYIFKVSTKIAGVAMATGLLDAIEQTLKMTDEYPDITLKLTKARRHINTSHDDIELYEYVHLVQKTMTPLKPSESGCGLILTNNEFVPNTPTPLTPTNSCNVLTNSMTSLKHSTHSDHIVPSKSSNDSIQCTTTSFKTAINIPTENSKTPIKQHNSGYVLTESKDSRESKLCSII